MSADRSHLIPTPITDRSGRKTTVYRRPAAAPTSSSKVPAPVVVAEGKSGKDRLTEILAELSRGQAMGAAKHIFIAGCTEEQARVIADAYEAHPGYAEILRAETTVHTHAAHHVSQNPRMAASIARVYEDDAVSFPDHDGSITLKAHLYHQQYSTAVLEATMAAARIGRPERGPMGGQFDMRHLETAQNGIRTWALLTKAPARSRDRDAILDAVMAGECTYAGVEAAIRDHGATEAQQIIGLAKGISPAVSDGWL